MKSPKNQKIDQIRKPASGTGFVWSVSIERNEIDFMDTTKVSAGCANCDCYYKNDKAPPVKDRQSEC